MWSPSAVAALVALLVIPVTGTAVENSAKIAPKVFIFSMVRYRITVFFPSQPVIPCSLTAKDAWFNIPEFNILDHNITVPGFPPLFPHAHCTKDGQICELVTGEAEINAAATISALVHSSIFDLKDTYFLIAGIAGGSPKHATTGSVTLARFAVQVALQYEIDAREPKRTVPTTPM